MIDTRNVPAVRLKPTIFSFGSTGKNSESSTGMSRRMLASHSRILATNNSPETPAAAKTGSGRDHRDPMVFLKLKFMSELQSVARDALIGASKRQFGSSVESVNKFKSRPLPGQQKLQTGVRKVTPDSCRGRSARFISAVKPIPLPLLAHRRQEPSIREPWKKE